MTRRGSQLTTHSKIIVIEINNPVFLYQVKVLYFLFPLLFSATGLGTNYVLVSTLLVQAKNNNGVVCSKTFYKHSFFGYISFFFALDMIYYGDMDRKGQERKLSTKLP